MSEQLQMTFPSRRRPPPTPASPLEDDDLLYEILLRLPPQPSSLPRASAVSTRWRRLVSDPQFRHRFCARHRRNAPLLGCFVKGPYSVSFFPTMEPPNRIPGERFSLRLDGDSGMLLGCCHGLVLLFFYHLSEVLVWNPATGVQRRIAIPPGFEFPASGAVLRTAAGDAHFQVVLVDTGDEEATVCVYSSEAGQWGNPVSTPLQGELRQYVQMIPLAVPSILVGNSLYWSILRNPSCMLEYDLGTQSLGVIHVPDAIRDFRDIGDQFWVTAAEGDGLGLLFLTDLSIQSWKRKTDCNGVASWVLVKTIELGELLSLNPEGTTLSIQGIAEDNNVVFLATATDAFMVQLESLQFKKLPNRDLYHPFTSVYTAGIGGGHDEAELLQIV